MRESEYVTGLVVVRTEPEQANRVAREASRHWGYPEGDIYLVKGVRWAAAVEGAAEDGSQLVVLAVRAANKEELEGLIERIRGISGVVNPTKHVVQEYYKDGKLAFAGQDGLP